MAVASKRRKRASRRSLAAALHHVAGVELFVVDAEHLTRRLLSLKLTMFLQLVVQLKSLKILSKLDAISPLEAFLNSSAALGVVVVASVRLELRYISSQSFFNPFWRYMEVCL